TEPFRRYCAEKQTFQCGGCRGLSVLTVSLSPHTPGISHQYQNKGLTKFDGHKSLIPKDAISVACDVWGQRKKKSGSLAAAVRNYKTA
ncbi:MAG TPA: hypothetical protein VEO53_10810, partial [Candidatus Binatia bacterium]|nr:hypothetical protein [Candidatus Binatia bacterium]